MQPSELWSVLNLANLERKIQTRRGVCRRNLQKLLSACYHKHLMYCQT